MNLTAFEIRLTNTWFSSAGSPMHGGSGSIDELDRAARTRRSLRRAALAPSRVDVDRLARASVVRPICENASRSSISCPMRVRVDLDALELRAAPSASSVAP